MKKIYSSREFLDKETHTKKSFKRNPQGMEKAYLRLQKIHKVCEDFLAQTGRKIRSKFHALQNDPPKKPTSKPLRKFHEKKPHQTPSKSDNMVIKVKRTRKQKIKKWFFLGMKICGFLAIAGIIFIIGVFIYFSKDLPEVGNVNSRFVAESTKIYDRSGEVLLYDIHGEEKRTIIPGSEIPQTIKQATIALEDHAFYTHHGIRFKAILRAVVSQVFGIGTKSGGSTITQQLIKNSILTSERTITRKIKEVILAIELEFTTEKEEILEMYLNEIPYGSNAYGIEAAANTFFGKNAKDLTYDEAAILAALPQAPSRYSPYGLNRELLKGRQERALSEMATLGFISQQQATDFKAVDVFAKIAKNREEINAPHFVFYVRDYLEEKYGAEYLEKNGLTITTTLDWEKQQIAERIVKEKALENKDNYNAENASLVAIDPKTGEILAMVGSRDYFDEEIDGQVNVALAKRQPGSSFKPYVYLQSFIEGYTPETILFDVETSFGVDRAPDYEPQNYDGEFRGPVKIKDALANSLNIPAVKALYLVGLDDTLSLTEDMGITTLNDPDRYGLSLVLGGGEVTLLDHTAAFSVLANKGKRSDKQGILEVKDRDGQTLEEKDDQKAERVIEEEFIDMLSHILSTNKYRIPAFGTSSALAFNDRPVAAKTGTTNENRDAWTMGYTPEVAVGVWGGNNDNSSMNNRGVGANVAAPIFRDFILEAYPDAEGQEFKKYDSEEVKTGKDILDGEIPKVEKIKVCEISDDKYCGRNKYCTDDSKKERAFFDLHNVLHYIQKDDPRGDKPNNPKDDPAYKNWEEGVVDFYKDQDDVIFSEPPKECRAEDFENEKLEISLSISTDGNEMVMRVGGDKPYDVEVYEYIVNGEQVAKFGGDRLEWTIPDEYNNTKIKIEVKAEDELGNKAETSKELNISF